jgi:4-carboxymuconolactone decarboxylase
MASDRPTRPRIEPIDLDDVTDDELRATLAGALTRDGRPLNIFGVLGHHPKLLKRFNLLGGFLLNKGLLPERERELVILRVGWNAQAVYEFGQHTVIGMRSGLTDGEIAALTTSPDQHDWSDDDRALIALADDLAADDCVSDETWRRLERALVRRRAGRTPRGRRLLSTRVGLPEQRRRPARRRCPRLPDLSLPFRTRPRKAGPTACVMPPRPTRPRASSISPMWRRPCW